LERQGWVTIERHRGAFVTALDPPAVRDHYELYGLVYGFAVRRALERTGPSIVDELAPLVRRMRGDDPAAAGQAILEFHRTVVNAARSSRIRVVLRAMSSLVPGDFFAEVPEAVGIERRGLGAVLRHLRAGDPDGAADAYARTMAQVGEAVVRLFEARGLFAAGPADRGAGRPPAHDHDLLCAPSDRAVPRRRIAYDICQAERPRGTKGEGDARRRHDPGERGRPPGRTARPLRGAAAVPLRGPGAAGGADRGRLGRLGLQ